MKWESSVKDGRKRNSRFVCLGCCQESLVLGGYNIWWTATKTTKEHEEPGEKKKTWEMAVGTTS